MSLERKKSALTPEQYSRAIISLSRRYSSTSVFPGNHYVDLAGWMLQERNLLSSAKAEADSNTSFASKSEHHHDLVVVYNTGDKKWDVQQYGQEQHEALSSNSSPHQDGSGQMVFIRGFLSPLWVSAIGSKYQVDPEFFRRHLEFLSVSVDRHAFSSPSLTSTSKNMFRLCVSTILHRDHTGEQDLRAQRKDQLAQLSAYKTQQLGSTKVSCGDSLVRDYSTVCPSFSVLEQWISICVTQQEKGWAVVAWMDQGRPLEDSPQGPWTSHIRSNATALPVLQSYSKMAFRTTTSRLDTSANASAEIQQSAAILPLQYDSLVALVDLTRRQAQDPLSMSIPLFAHAAFSELQFLNLMESKIQHQLNAISERLPADALETFQFFSNILNRHAKYLQEALRAFRRLVERSTQGQHGLKSDIQGPKSSSVAPSVGRSTHRQSAETEGVRIAAFAASDGAFTGIGLLEDFDELLVRCVDLSQMCTRGINLAMNKATIDESRKGIEQSERLKRLTLLATFFIPLSFCSSLFGMNLDILAQSRVRFWWFFVLCIPITGLAYVLYLWDWQAVRSFFVKERRRIPMVGLNGSGDRTGRDADHMV